jgi:hypothetical protein
MKMPGKYILLLAMGLFSCQDSFSQYILMLSKLGKTEHKYFSFDDYMQLKIHPNGKKVSGAIIHIGDSSMAIGKNYNIPYKDIAAIRQDVFWPGLVSKIALIAGAGYLTLDVVNNLITNEQVFEPSTLYISGSLVAFGLILIPLSHRYIPIGVRWKLTVMEQPLPFR